MIRLSAPLPSLTAFIVQDTERLHFASATIMYPPSQDLASCPAQSLTILPVVPPDSIYRRLATLTDVPLSALHENLAPIDPSRPLFHLTQPPSAALPTADLYLPQRQFSRVQTAVHQFRQSGDISFPVASSPANAAAALLPGNAAPNPLALLFLHEHRIFCQTLPNLEIAIRTPEFTDIHHPCG